MMKIAIFHGWGANSKDNWFPWLKEELEKEGHEVFCPDLPDTNKPNYDNWMPKALEFDYDEDTVLVGHSCGTILIMHLLSKFKVKSAYLVSAFDSHLDLDSIKGMFKIPFDYDKIKQNSKKITILNSDNDPYISMDVANRLQKNLDAGMIIYEGLNHISNGTGDLRFPELLQMIQNDNNKKD